MRLRIVGCHSPFALAGQVTPGYLVESDGTRILLDCGFGVVSGLSKYIAVESLTSVVISHLHPDHSADLIPLGFALMVAKSEGKLEPPMKVFVPQGGSEIFHSVLQVQGNLAREVLSGMELIEYQGETIEVDNLTLQLAPTGHRMNCHCVRISTGTKSLGYTADTAYQEELASIFAGVDLLLAEAGAVSEEQAKAASHMLPEEAGKLGEETKAGKLVLTHFLPGTDTEDVAKRARTTYSGELIIAEEGLLVEV
ncbi:MAG: MBL fold metallo-hydrolase [Firmicutes bacterium]|nr:MBL fold metallo-hydrolase [Bacillota bacterium]